MSNQSQGQKQAQHKAPASPAKPAEIAQPVPRPGRTRCRVELSAVYSDGKQYEPGSIGEFDDADVLDPRLAKFLIPVE